VTVVNAVNDGSGADPGLRDRPFGRDQGDLFQPVSFTGATRTSATSIVGGCTSPFPTWRTACRDTMKEIGVYRDWYPFSPRRLHLSPITSGLTPRSGTQPRVIRTAARAPSRRDWRRAWTPLTAFFDVGSPGHERHHRQRARASLSKLRRFSPSSGTNPGDARGLTVPKFLKLVNPEDGWDDGIMERTGGTSSGSGDVVPGPLDL
jgi:hypothetical protein